MERYNAIKKHSTPPMAKLIDDKLCGGCNMSFPSSVLIDIKAGKYVECETCGRMIILKNIEAAKWSHALHEGKSEHRRAECQITSAWRQLKESATEIYRRFFGRVEKVR